MSLLLLVFCIISLLMLAMAVGVLFGRKPISGSCGGLNLQPGQSCQLCGGRPETCAPRKDADDPAVRDDD